MGLFMCMFNLHVCNVPFGRGHGRHRISGRFEPNYSSWGSRLSSLFATDPLLPRGSKTIAQPLFALGFASYFQSMAEEIASVDRLVTVESQISNVLSRGIVQLTQRMRTLEATVESLSDAMTAQNANAIPSPEALPNAPSIAEGTGLEQPGAAPTSSIPSGIPGPSAPSLITPSSANDMIGVDSALESMQASILLHVDETNRKLHDMTLTVGAHLQDLQLQQPGASQIHQRTNDLCPRMPAKMKPSNPCSNGACLLQCLPRNCITDRMTSII